MTTLQDRARAPFPLEGGKAGIGGEARNVSGTSFEGARPAKTGVRRARRLRKEATVAERALWTELRKLGLNIRRQVPIGPYVADFAQLASKLVIEIDGYYHTLPKQAARDAERTTWLASRGYRVVRFDEALVRNATAAVIEQILTEIRPGLAVNSERALSDGSSPSAATPPSPTLPPSRGKGVRL